MKRLFIICAALLLSVGLHVSGAQNRDAGAEKLLARAQHKATVDRDLRGAIEDYKTAVAAAGANRALAARALVEMAEAYTKLGDAEAQKVYERVVREFGDQKQAVATANARLGASRVAVTSGVLNRQVWTGSDVDSLGTLSRDGRYLSCVDWDTGDLIVRDMATGTKRRLTNKGSWDKSADFAEESAISRDGSHISYSWFNDKTQRYELRLIRFDANDTVQPRILFDNPDVVWVAPFDWTPDGKYIAIQVQRQDRTAQIGLIGVANGSFAPLLSTDWRGSTRLFLSPDGSLVALDLAHEDGSPGRDVFVMRTDGSGKFPIAPHPAEEMVVGWSPDGKLLLFASDRAGSTDLWSVPIVNGQPGALPTLLRSSVGQLRDSVGLDQSGGLVYAVRTSATTIATAVLDLDKGTVTSGPTTPFENYLSTLRGPDWSKDGTLVAISEQSPTRLALTFRTAEGKRLRDVPLPMQYAQRPRWAPDGTITLQGVDLKGRQGIHRFNPDSGQLELLVLREPSKDLGVISHPTWLPGGEQLMFQRNMNNGTQRLLVLRTVRTGEERVLIDHPRLVGGHTMSPDGRSVAFVTEDQKGGTSTLAVLDIAGGSRREILTVSPPARLGGLSLWTPDGRSILFVRLDNGKPSLWVVRASGGSLRAINLELGPDFAALRMHPDGRRVAYNTGTRASELWRLDNFLPRETGTSTRR